MSDFISSSTRSENKAIGICCSDKYQACISSFLMQTDERADSGTAHRFKYIEAIITRLHLIFSDLELPIASII